MIVRVHKVKNFTVMDNTFLDDFRLSLRSVGLMAKILRLPPKWDFSTRGLAAIVKDGVASVSAGLKELEQAGYLVRTRARRPDGTLGKAVFDLYENPQSLENAGIEPNTGKPAQVSPAQGKPAQGKPAQISTYQSITYPSNTDKKGVLKNGYDENNFGSNQNQNEDPNAWVDGYC